jgi:hypothetical protein
LLLALVDQVQLLVAILLLHHSLQLAVEVVALQVVVALAENSNHLVVLDQDSQELQVKETLAEAQHTNLDHMTLAVVVVVLEVLVEIQAAVLEVMAVQALLLQ